MEQSMDKYKIYLNVCDGVWVWVCGFWNQNKCAHRHFIFYYSQMHFYKTMSTKWFANIFFDFVFFFTCRRQEALKPKQHNTHTQIYKKYFLSILLLSRKKINGVWLWSSSTCTTEKLTTKQPSKLFKTNKQQ